MQGMRQICPTCCQPWPTDPVYSHTDKPTANLRWAQTYNSVTGQIRQILEQEFVREIQRESGAVDTERVWKSVPTAGNIER
jgi:hypothetical protein